MLRKLFDRVVWPCAQVGMRIIILIYEIIIILNHLFLFYEYPEDDWQRKDTKLGVSYTNRVRYPEYMEFFRENGFEVVNKRLISDTLPKNIVFDSTFRKFSPEEHSVSKLSILL